MSDFVVVPPLIAVSASRGIIVLPGKIVHDLKPFHLVSSACLRGSLPPGLVDTINAVVVAICVSVLHFAFTHFQLIQS